MNCHTWSYKHDGAITVHLCNDGEKKKGVDSTGEISHRKGQAYRQVVTMTVHLCNDDEKKKRDG
jgi:hypothetical protein